MPALKTLLPLLALAKYATAQCSVSATTTVHNQAEASAIAGCSTFSGSVAIASDAPSMLSFDGSLSSITENFVARNATQLNSLSAGGLQTIGGTFLLNGLTTLSSLTMPQLTIANIEWITLPSLQGITFGSFQNATSINIQDTQLQKLDQLNVLSARTINIANNGILNSINWQITNCSGTFSINSNHVDGGLNASFPNLVGVGNMEVRNVSSLMLPSLANVNGTLSVAGSQYLESLMLPNLTSSKGLAVLNNPSLTKFTAPKFQDDEGGFVILNNDKLGGLLSFPALTTIRGAMIAKGSFTGLSMPKINLIRGASDVISTENLGNTCGTWGPSGSLKRQGIIQSRPICQSSARSNSGSSSNTGSSSSSTSSSAAIGNFDPSGFYTGAFGLIAALLGVL